MGSAERIGKRKEIHARQRGAIGGAEIVNGSPAEILLDNRIGSSTWRM
jgi:hypothetical protein